MLRNLICSLAIAGLVSVAWANEPATSEPADATVSAQQQADAVVTEPAKPTKVAKKAKKARKTTRTSGKKSEASQEAPASYESAPEAAPTN